MHKRGYRCLVSHAAVGVLLRDWRARRRVSQLDLSLSVGVSARHLSFIETGRSRPSPEMVLALAEGLDIPLRERNTLLLAAGFAPPPSQLTVKAGQSLVIPLTVFAPASANMNFTLSCSGLPANSSCAFDANPVAPAATGTAVKLTLSTMAGSTITPQAPCNGVPALPSTGLAAALATFFALATAVAMKAMPSTPSSTVG